MAHPLLDAALRARHDLGKYACFQLRWLGEAPSDAELLEALRADLLHTRRGRTGVESAPEVWDRLRDTLPGLDLAPVDAPVDRIRAALPALSDGSADRAAMEEAAHAARALADALDALVRSLR